VTVLLGITVLVMGLQTIARKVTSARLVQIHCDLTIFVQLEKSVQMDLKLREIVQLERKQ